MAAVALRGVEKRHSNGHLAVAGIDLDVADGEFLVLVGPSGCGKSTLLRLVAGLETPTAGRVQLDGADVTDVPPQRRDLAMVFQSYALYPHMTVRQNLGYGLRVRGVDQATIAQRLQSVAESLELAPLLDRRPAQLSGGQRQRVALGRAMVRDPKAFLLDEPLSNLDPSLRLQARTELLHLHRRLGATVIYVTHDQEEAMTLGGRVAVMRDGRIEQVGPPLEIYGAPANTFVARFIGVPPMNLIAGPIPQLEVPPGITVGIRPHDVEIAGGGQIAATVDVVEPRGYDSIVHLRAAIGTGVSLVAVVADAPAVGDEVRLSIPGNRVHLFGADDRRVGTGIADRAKRTR
jgi:ABC-type sugar transport system ATPase subunit